MKIKEIMDTLQLNKLFDKGDRKFNRLMTPWGEQIAQEQTETVLTEYPRPQMARKNHIILNGIWKYAITGDDERPVLWDGDIRVPFSPETYLSGVQRQLKPDEYLWYERKLMIDRIPMEKRLLLNFGACDERCRVYVNDTLAGTHSGGYQAFTIDITDCIRHGKNTLRLCVQDKSDTSYHGRGKQMLKNGGMFYTAQSGLWQTVWCEWVPEIYIRELRITPQYDDDSVSIEIMSNKYADAQEMPEEKAEARKFPAKSCYLSRTELQMSSVSAFCRKKRQSSKSTFPIRKAGRRNIRFYMIFVLYTVRIWWRAILACVFLPQSLTAAGFRDSASTTSPIFRKASLTKAIIPKVF